MVIDFKKLNALLDSSHDGKWIAIAPDYSHIVDIADTLPELMTRVGDRNIFYHPSSSRLNLSKGQQKEVRRRRAERKPNTLSLDQFNGRLRRFGV